MKAPKPLHYQVLETLLTGKQPDSCIRLYTARAKVPGGWLVATGGTTAYAGVTFYPDPEHKWDGSSLD